MSLDQSAISAHRDYVRILSKPGNALAPDSPNATVNNPEWFRNKGGVLKPRAARVQLHEQLKALELAKYPGVQQGKRAVILAGPPGAGKSTQRDRLLEDTQHEYLRIDADDFKESLLLQAVKDGSLDSFIIPAAVRDAAAAGQEFFPMELASLVHEESSLLAKQLRSEAIAREDNIIIDAVLSSVDGARALGRQLQEGGYEVQVIDVEVPFAISEDRIALRWQQSYEAAVKNKDHEDPTKRLGGRWVPSEYARQVYSGPGGTSLSEGASEVLARECTAVVRYRRFRTTRDASGEDSEPTLEVDLSRVPGKRRLVLTSKMASPKMVGMSDIIRKARSAKSSRSQRISPSAGSTPARDSPPKRGIEVDASDLQPD